MAGSKEQEYIELNVQYLDLENGQIEDVYDKHIKFDVSTGKRL